MIVLANYKGHTLICDYLDRLGVPHTAEYSESRFSGMPFQTWFGLSKLLAEYGVASEGYRLDDNKELLALAPPFLAKTIDGTVIVTSLAPDKVGYLTQGEPETIPLDDFMKVWTGEVLLSFPKPDAKEPDYTAHARLEFLMKCKKWVLAFCVTALLAYFFVTRRIYTSLSATLLTVIDLMGIYLTYLLVQKSVNIHNKTADKFCGVLQEGGCDSVLSMKASKFFGLFGWSEVGFSYFSVSLAALLAFPYTLPWLALCNVCCLPFTFWSIWYQRFRAHHWCTLCVCVQASLWLLFLCYLLGGWLEMAFPIRMPFVVLGLAYVAVMLGINALMPLIEKSNPKDDAYEEASRD